MKDGDPHRPPSAESGDESSGALSETDVGASGQGLEAFDPSEQKTVLRPSGPSGRRASGVGPPDARPLTDDLSPTVAVPPDSHTRRPSGPASSPSSGPRHTTPGGTTDSIVREGRFGKYQIFEKLGSGGFGKVYRGRDPLLSRDVAVKTCTSEDERLRRRFLHEAKIAAGLQHPNIVTVHDFGFEGDMPYMVQEYLTGEDLTEKIARRDLSVRERARFLLHIAQGLAHAHDHSVVHRDIKPGNIRITDDGQLRVLDFGIARLLDQTRPFTTDGVTLGTVGYMAPELLSDDEVDWRCDIFSYGVVAYELLSYSLPFQGDTFVRISYRLLNEEPPSLAEVAPDCPPALVHLVERCLRKRREERYTTFHQVVEELTRLLDDTVANPSSSSRTESGAVLSVSGGAPTTPVPQAAVAAATTSPSPASTPVSASNPVPASASVPASTAVPASPSAPSPNGAPTAPVEGRGGFGMRQVMGLIGLGLGVVVIALFLPGMVSEWTAPSQDIEPQQVAEDIEATSIPAATPEPSTAALAEPSASESVASRGALPGSDEETSDPPVRASSGLPASSGNDVVKQNRPSEGAPLLQDPEQTSSVSNRPGEVAVAAPVKVPEEASGAVEPSPDRRADVDSASTAPETPPSADPSTEVGQTDPAAAVPTSVSMEVSSTGSATLPPPASAAPTVADGSSGSEVTDPPPTVPAEIVPPQLLEQVQPEYPSRARRRRLEANVTVAVWVEADGRVARTIVKSVSARGMGFEEAAIEAARKSRFASGTEDGVPMAMWTEIVFHFRLSG